MAVKRRKLSPSASSHSSTPAPTVSYSVHPPSSPAASESLGLSRLSDSATPGPAQSLALSRSLGKAKIQDERTTAKPGVIQPGSGDGQGCGDECYLWADLPMNKNAFRYLPCGPSPTPSPVEYHPFYRTIPFSPPTPPVHISWLDRSNFLRLSPDALTATTDRGFRSGRASVSVREGTWYFEATVLRGNAQAGASKGSGGEMGNAHVRVGWGRREAGLDAPVGADGYAYGIRDVGGDKVHCARPTPYGRVEGQGGGFGIGDVVGCLISLPTRGIFPEDRQSMTVKTHRRRICLRYKGQNYLEIDEYPTVKEMEALVDRDGKFAQARLDAELAAKAGKADKEKGDGMGAKGKKTKNAKKGKEVKKADQPSAPVFRDLERIPGSKIEFYINGQSLGTAFENLYDFLPLPPLPPPETKKHGHHASEKEAMGDDGTLGYYPMISCFGRGKLKLNFGPTFAHPPPEELGARPMSDRWAEHVEEERGLDEKEEREMRVHLELEVENERKRAEEQETKAAKKAEAAAGKAKAAAGKKGAVGGSPLSGAAKRGKQGTGTPTPSKLAQPPPPGSINGYTPDSPTILGGVYPSAEPDAHGDIDMDASTSGDHRFKHELSSAAGSTPASPTPGYDSGTPLAAVAKGKKGKAKAKAKVKGKGKSKLVSGLSESSRATSVSAPSSRVLEADMPSAQPLGNGHTGGVEGEGEDADAEGEEDAEGEVDEEYAAAAAPVWTTVKAAGKAEEDEVIGELNLDPESSGVI